jgi:hypothetical protein
MTINAKSFETPSPVIAVAAVAMASTTPNTKITVTFAKHAATNIRAYENVCFRVCVLAIHAAAIANAAVDRYMISAWNASDKYTKTAAISMARPKKIARNPWTGPWVPPPNIEVF